MDKLTLLEKTLPHSEDAEVAVIGAMLLDKEAVPRVLEILNDACFYAEKNKRVFRAIVGLFERNESPSAVLVVEELKRRGELDGVGGAYYLSTLLDSVATSANVESHARVVLERAIQRRLIHAATAIATRGYEAREDVSEMLDAAEKAIFEISESRLRQGFLPIKDILRGTFETIQRLYDDKSHMMGQASGFVDLDAMTSGFQAGDLVIVAGRPSTGKTSFALNIAQHVAVEQRKPVGVFSLEMSKEQLVQRLLCSEARVDAHRLRTGYLRDDEWPMLTVAASVLAEAPLYIDDSAALSILELRAKARRLHDQVDLGLIIVDYLQLLRGSGRPENRQQEIAQISRSLKALAKEIGVPVIALSQLSRAVEQRGKDQRPQLSDLRESGAIEQDADLVLFVFRRWSNDPEVVVDDTVAEIIIGKQRNGPVGTVRLAFMKPYTRFENWSGRVAMGVGGADDA
ncbi:MAG: replicative DNA helicase [bacterium]